MLQVIQHQKTGKLSVEDFPPPRLRIGQVLVRNHCSVVSAGTERISIETAQASLVGKARLRPDLVKQVMDAMKREGVTATYAKVKNRLDNYKELGYSSAGIVLESAVDGISPGDRVACAGTAYHAEIVSVPKHLVAKMPGGVTFEEGAFTTLGAIAMQGVRQANVRLGETVAVIGVGLIGLITVQLLKAAGCRVVGLDVNEGNFDLARSLGSDECFRSHWSNILRVSEFTKGFGVDAVIITAATKSNDPVELACAMARKKGRIVIVGAVRMDIPRKPFYEKELELTIASSYGPGRYDREYEEQGLDYPIGYVRWTLNRNMESVLTLMSEKHLSIKPLITHRFPITKALEAYDLITGKKKEKYVGIVIQYAEAAAPQKLREKVETQPQRVRSPGNRIVAGFIGAGNFAQSYLLPFLPEAGVHLRGVATSSPVNAQSVGKKFGFEFSTTNPQEILDDDAINTVFVATRHDSHARYVVEAMKRGKNVYVEKPLAIKPEELGKIRKAFEEHAGKGLQIMVGFNRRFSKPFNDIKTFLAESREPMIISYRVNAGTLPPSHWMSDRLQGGRIVGEACHFIDCMKYLTSSEPIRVFAESVSSSTNGGSTENVNVALRFADGSVGNLLYLANGDPSAGKEYCEVHRGGLTAIMSNFGEVLFFRDGKRTKRRYDGSKGHREEMRQVVQAFEGKGGELISFESLFTTTDVTFKILESLRRGRPIEV